MEVWKNKNVLMNGWFILGLSSGGNLCYILNIVM